MKIFKQYIYPRLILDLVTFFIPLMAIGIIAARLDPFSKEVWLGILANYLMLIFAFIYNDIEDSEDDAKYKFEALSMGTHLKMNLGLHEQKAGLRRFQNPFSNGMLTKQDGFNILLSIIFISVIISFFVGGFYGFLLALSNIVMGILYSGGIVRFKAYLMLDILSHCYLLAGVQILYFFAYPQANIDLFSYILLAAAMSYSIGGDLWNEYRDFDEDTRAGLKNTASYLGKSNTNMASKFLTIASLMIALSLSGYLLVF